MYHTESQQITPRDKRSKTEDGLHEEGNAAMQRFIRQRTTGPNPSEHTPSLIHQQIISDPQEVGSTINARGYNNHWTRNGDESFDVLQSDDEVWSSQGTIMVDPDDGLTRKNLAGFIFMCNKRTMKECFYNGIFGLPYNSWDMVSQIAPGTILFLFEYEARKMWGIYEAVSHGTLNINAHAYSKGSFPAQVRIKEIENCPPLEEDEFKDAIRDKYYTDMKFNFDLSYDQVFRLCEAFLWKLTGNSDVHSIENGTCIGSPESYLPRDNNTNSYDRFTKQLTADGGHASRVYEGHLEGCYSSDYSNDKVKALKGSHVETVIADNMSRLGHFPSSQSRQSLFNPEACILRGDRRKLRPSVWSRISGRLSVDEALEKGFAERELERPNRDAILEESFCAFEQGNIDGLARADCVEEDELSDQTDNEFLVSFKRRSSTRDGCVSHETGNTDEKRRRKLMRPDFLRHPFTKDNGTEKHTSDNLSSLGYKEKSDEICSGEVFKAQSKEHLENDNCTLQDSKNIKHHIGGSSSCINGNSVNGGNKEQEDTGLDKRVHNFSIVLEVGRSRVGADENVKNEKGKIDLNNPICLGSSESEEKYPSVKDNDCFDPCLQLELRTDTKKAVLLDQGSCVGLSLGLSLHQSDEVYGSLSGGYTAKMPADPFPVTNNQSNESTVSITGVEVGPSSLDEQSRDLQL